MKAVAALQDTDVVRVHVFMTYDAGILRVQLHHDRRSETFNS